MYVTKKIIEKKENTIDEIRHYPETHIHTHTHTQNRTDGRSVATL